jgi:predicted double-glycine peptidase
VIGNGFQGGHFVVVTGYDNDHIYMHDPLFGNIKSAALGHHHGVPNDLFASGWGSTRNAENRKRITVRTGRLPTTVMWSMLAPRLPRLRLSPNRNQYPPRPL